MKLARTFALVATVALGATLSVGNASADPATGGFAGTAKLPGFGTGGTISGGTFEGTFLDAQGNHNGNFTANFTYSEPVETCPAQGTATGTISAPTSGLSASFTWQRVGATAVVNISGSHSGSAVAAFSVKKPTGNPCGAGYVEAWVVGGANAS